MADPRFFTKTGPVSLGDLARLTGATLAEDADPSRMIDDAAPLERAGPSSVSYLDHKKYWPALEASEAGACFVPAKLADRPAPAMQLICDDPKLAYARAAALFYSERTWTAPGKAAGSDGPVVHPGAHVADDAQIGAGTQIHSGAVIGPRVEIGERCVIAPGAVVGDGVTIGHDTRIGATCVLQCAQIGDRVILHPGVLIGQDGFGFTPDLATGTHVKIPQLGRVIIQNDVEIGAGCTLDRAASGDTLIGEGTKIDNLVQIGHNSQTGRHCIIIAQSGLGGSTVLEDYVVLGGGVGTAGHQTIGKGAQIAARSGVKGDIPAGEIWGGYPAKPIMQWRREVGALSQLVKKRGRTGQGSPSDAPVPENAAQDETKDQKGPDNERERH